MEVTLEGRPRIVRLADQVCGSDDRNADIICHSDHDYPFFTHYKHLHQNLPREVAYFFLISRLSYGLAWSFTI